MVAGAGFASPFLATIPGTDAYNRRPLELDDLRAWRLAYRPAR